MLTESEVNKNLCLYIKQDYSKTRQDEIQRLKASIKQKSSSIDKKVKQIKELEESQLRSIELLGALDRFIDIEKKGESSKRK